MTEANKKGTAAAGGVAAGVSEAGVYVADVLWLIVMQQGCCTWVVHLAASILAIVVVADMNSHCPC